MIESFNCKDTRALYETGKSRRWSSVLDVAPRKLTQLSAAVTLAALGYAATAWSMHSGQHLAPSAAAYEKILIYGRVVDGDGNPVNDTLLEIWQADVHGKYAHPDDHQHKPTTPGFTGFDRVAADEQGAFHFSTIKQQSALTKNRDFTECSRTI